MFSKIFSVRWLPTSQYAYDTIKLNYKVFISHLTRTTTDIRGNSKRPADVVTEAQALLNIFTDRNLVSTIHHHLDILYDLSKWAKWLPRKGGTVIDLKSWILYIAAKFESLKTKNGPYLGIFLESCTCDGVLGIELFTDGSDIPKLSTTKVETIVYLQKSFATRFPIESIEAYSVFNPRDFGEISADGFEPTLVYLKRMYDYDERILLPMLKNLQLSIKTSEFYKTNQRDPPEVFWPLALANSHFGWNSVTRRIITLALIQTVGTARVESGFSNLSFIKNQWRTNLSIPNAEHQLRLRFNTPPIDKFSEYPKFRMAQRWIQTGHLRSDDPRKQAKPRTKSGGRGFLPSSRI